jgi:ABC-type uncharacterized transport system permease subunit
MNWAALIGPAALVPLFAAAFRLAIPMILAAVGECAAQRGGVYNLGLEGTMLMGAVAAFLAAERSGSPLLGAFAGTVAGIVTGCLVAMLTVGLRLDQIIVGIAVTILGGGLSSFLYFNAYGFTSSPPSIRGFARWDIPVLGDIPGIGVVLFQQTPLVYASAALAAVVVYVLTRTTFGLAVRAAGQAPEALEASGRSVASVRWAGLVISGGMTGLAGAVLVDGLGLFREYLTAGRGWVAVALVILARWNPLGTVAGGFMFGLADALQLRVQAVSGGVESAVPYEFFQALPYLATLTVVVTATIRLRGSREPAALGQPFVRSR